MHLVMHCILSHYISRKIGRRVQGAMACWFGPAGSDVHVLGANQFPGTGCRLHTEYMVISWRLGAPYPLEAIDFPSRRLITST